MPKRFNIYINSAINAVMYCMIVILPLACTGGENYCEAPKDLKGMLFTGLLISVGYLIAVSIKNW